LIPNLVQPKEDSVSNLPTHAQRPAELGQGAPKKLAALLVEHADQAERFGGVR